MQLNGIQLNTKPGMNFQAQYNVPDTGLTNNTTLSQSSATYNLSQVDFKGKQSEYISRFNQNDLFLNNGLRPNQKGWIG